MKKNADFQAWTKLVQNVFDADTIFKNLAKNIEKFLDIWHLSSYIKSPFRNGFYFQARIVL